MKPIIPRLAHHVRVILFPLLLLKRPKWRFYISLLLGILILTGCFRKFYDSNTTQQFDAGTIEKLKDPNKYFIIHFQDSILHLSDLTVSNNVITGYRGPLTIEHGKQLNPDIDKPNAFKGGYKAGVLSEVHLYVNNKAASTDYPEVKIPLSDLYRMDVYELNEKRTQTSKTLSILGIAATGALVVIAIVAGSSGVGSGSSSSDSSYCGCPQVYVERKGNFDFQNGLFSGAVYANLERTDYLPLGNIQPENSAVRLRITGHDNEIQYLNSAQLVGVQHPAGSQVLADRFGTFYSISNPELPLAATALPNQDLKETLKNTDGISYPFNTYDAGEDFSKTYLTFRNPLLHKTAKLLIRAKNSNWAAMLDQEYTLLFGDDYSRYRNYVERKNKNNTAAFLEDQALPMKVYIESEGKWEYAGYYPLSGTENYREMVMQINLPEKKDNVFRIKLETVYRFWDLDYAAIDYTEDAVLPSFTLNPVSALNAARGNQNDQLSKIDNTYSQLNNNESIDLSFQVSQNGANDQVAYFLSASGYYHVEKTYPVKANIARLKQFEKAGAFDRFSREKYREMEQLQALTKKVNQASN